MHSNCAATQALDTRRIEHQLHLFNALQLPCTGAAVMRRACIQPLHLSSALQLRCYRRSNANASSSPCCICSMHCDYLAIHVRHQEVRHYWVALVQCTSTALLFVNRLSLVASMRCTDTDSVPGFLLRLKSTVKNQGAPTCPQMYPQKRFC